MRFDNLINELKSMFRYKQNKVTTRRIFETRIWKDETFREYVHKEVIMGNRVPMEATKMMNYIIDGIPDNVLRNQTRIQRFTETVIISDIWDNYIARLPCDRMESTG